MSETTTTETTAEAATDAAVTDLDTARTKRRPSSRERARAASAGMQAAASGAAPKSAPAKAAPAKADVTGGEPHTARLRERFEALSATKRKAAIRAARAALEAGATRAAAWNAAMAEVAPEPAKAGPKAKEPRPAAKFRGVAVKGYTVRWPHGGYDLLASDDKMAGRPAWLVRCNLHGTTRPVKAAKEGDALGTRAVLPAWCDGCKIA